MCVELPRGVPSLTFIRVLMHVKVRSVIVVKCGTSFFLSPFAIVHRSLAEVRIQCKARILKTFLAADDVQSIAASFVYVQEKK